MGLDERIGPQFLRAGRASGSCLPKDVSGLKQLAGNSGYHFQLLTSVIEVNELQKRRLIGKLSSASARWSGSGSRCLGSPSSPIQTTCAKPPASSSPAGLESEGAEVVAYDPVAAEKARSLLPGVEIAESALEALDGADAAVLVTEWPDSPSSTGPRRRSG